MPTTWLDVDLGAIAHNVRELKGLVAPAALCVVVKADAYGHGAVPVASVAVDAGAKWLAVAHVEEGVTLRKAGLAVPILVLSEPSYGALTKAAQYDLRVTLYSREGVSAAQKIAHGERHHLDVHLKVDTGMRRVGVEPSEALVRAKAIMAAPNLNLEGVWTHLAVADQTDHPFTKVQLERYSDVLRELETNGITPPLRHAANTAGALAHPQSHFDMVRAGIGTYGVSPLVESTSRFDLRPTMALRSQVSYIKRVKAGEGISYGLNYVCDRDTNVATVPVGYADGVRRSLSRAGGYVLISGRPRPLIGNVTMDQLMVDCGDDEVFAGDEVVLLGHQDSAQITLEDWARWLDTIPYEVMCGFGNRVVRRYQGGRSR